jgi:hypothetical protein
MIRGKADGPPPRRSHLSRGRPSGCPGKRVRAGAFNAGIAGLAQTRRNTGPLLARGPRRVGIHAMAGAMDGSPDRRRARARARSSRPARRAGRTRTRSDTTSALHPRAAVGPGSRPSGVVAHFSVWNAGAGDQTRCRKDGNGQRETQRRRIDAPSPAAERYRVGCASARFRL